MNARAEPPEFFDDQVAQLRVPPHSLEAESSVLGSLLLQNNAWDRVGDLLVEGDFYRHEHKAIYAAIGALIHANKPADAITVFEYLKSRGKDSEAGGLQYLAALAQYESAPGSVRRYAEIVRERSVLRNLISTSDEIATEAFNTQGKDVDAILDGAVQKLMAINSDAPRDDWQDGDTGVLQVLDAIQLRHDGGQGDFIPTGLVDLDEKLNGGLRPGKVYVVAARPSMGKTALALSIGEHVAMNEGKPVGVLSMEMPKDEVQERRVSMKSHVPYHKILRPERMSDFEWSQMCTAVETLRRVPLYISDQNSLNINQVRSKARALKRRHGLAVLVVDYVGLMEGTDRKANRATQLGEVSRGIKALAKELGVAILLLAQLNREVEKRPNMRPILADLRECGDIEQDADVVLFVHRAFHVKPDLGPEWKHYSELILAKHRGGACGLLDAQFIGESMRFCDWPRDTPKPTSQVRSARASGGDL
jgi:replicative DNA helicase